LNQFKARLVFLSAFLALSGLAVVIRLFSVQVLHGGEYAARSKMQSQERCFIPAQRGEILDRSGHPLAMGAQNDLSLTADLLGAASPKDNGRSPMKRVYPLGEASGPLVGYVGKDGYGLDGVEFSFDKYLRGEDGWTIFQKDGRNHRYRKPGMPFKDPVKGSSVYLTIDAEVQKIAYSVLKQTVETLKAKGGRCMVMDPANGKILAMVNVPSFDPNAPARFPLAQRQNGCIGAIYEPGSTFKVVSTAAALQDNIRREQDVIDGRNGKFEICGQVIKDHVPYGKLTFAQALSYSSNVCFAQIAIALGNLRFFRFTQDFGFGSRTGINLPGEEAGIVHPVRSWSGRTLATMAIGQEVSVTLLQMMLAYATVANGGVLLSPQICEKVVAPDGAVGEQSKEKPVRRVLSQETARRLCVMLKAVVDSGTGKNAGISNLSIAGKTGTAQKLDAEGYSKTRSWASFMGFLPIDHPSLLCGIIIDEPADNLMGGTAAAPAFKKVVTQIISHPSLEFAEKILKNRQIIVRDDDEKNPENTAVAKVNASVGKPAVANALPGMPVHAAAPSAVDPKAVPDCIGKDARDAIHLFGSHGLVPHVIGAGTVRRQIPAAGSLTNGTPACTLVCSFGG
jgi:cell division protein FtsI (penicillin-binding protein 3)